MFVNKNKQSKDHSRNFALCFLRFTSPALVLMKRSLNKNFFKMIALLIISNVSSSIVKSNMAISRWKTNFIKLFSYIRSFSTRRRRRTRLARKIEERRRASERTNYGVFIRTKRRGGGGGEEASRLREGEETALAS